MQHRMPNSGLFAVLRGIDTQPAVEVADVAVSAGFDRIEVTTNMCVPAQTDLVWVRHFVKQENRWKRSGVTRMNWSGHLGKRSNRPNRDRINEEAVPS